VVNFPARGIGARSLESLQDAARAGNASLFNAVASLSGKTGNALGGFVALIEAMRRDTAGLPLPEVVEHMLAKSGLLAHFQAEKDGADRVENLQELVNAAATFVQEADEAQGLAEFLAHAALEAGEHQAGEGSDALQLMTVHSAKGLEFQAVFITGMEEGLFPHEQSANAEDGLEEERRLAYVAITRARSRLYLSFAQSRILHGQTRYNVASRFLDEIPAGLLKWLTPRVLPGAGQAYASPYRAHAPETSPIPKREPRAGEQGWRIGQNVLHPKFGQGVIVDSEGQGSDARLQVNFGRQGMKWLALEYAKLTAA
jgi:DNA helicase-2/ATP-dependent DNA helicase PcrA